MIGQFCALIMFLMFRAGTDTTEQMGTGGFRKSSMIGINLQSSAIRAAGKMFSEDSQMMFRNLFRIVRSTAAWTMFFLHKPLLDLY